jgi:hypothetical protein
MPSLRDEIAEILPASSLTYARAETFCPSAKYLHGDNALYIASFFMDLLAHMLKHLISLPCSYILMPNLFATAVCLMWPDSNKIAKSSFFFGSYCTCYPSALYSSINSK